MDYPNGYCAIGVYEPIYNVNLGLLWRSALLLDASAMFTIGKEYFPVTSDTTQAHRHLPLYNYKDMADLEEHLPMQAEIICVELTDSAENLVTFQHPKQAIYLLGSEVQGLPETITNKYRTIKIPMSHPMSMNVSFTGSIVLYDRLAKLSKKAS